MRKRETARNGEREKGRGKKRERERFTKLNSRAISRTITSRSRRYESQSVALSPTRNLETVRTSERQLRFNDLFASCFARGDFHCRRYRDIADRLVETEAGRSRFTSSSPRINYAGKDHNFSACRSFSCRRWLLSLSLSGPIGPFAFAVGEKR